MGQDTAAAGAAKAKFRIWLPVVACPVGVVIGRFVGQYTLAALGFHMPAAPAGIPRSLYNGGTAGEIYGGIGALLAGFMVALVAPRLNRWRALAISLMVGALSAAVGAVLEA
jgi:hypothetical protein